MNVVTNELEKLVLTQISTAELEEDGAIVGVKVYLFTNDIALGKDTEFDDLEQPTFTGYAASAAVTLGAPILADDGSYTLGGDLKQFACSGGTPDEEIVGAAIAIGTNPNEVLLWAEKFAEPVRINGVGQGLRYAPSLKLGAGDDKGSGLVLA